MKVLIVLLMFSFLGCVSSGSTTRIVDTQGKVIYYEKDNRIMDTKGKVIYYKR